VASEGLKARMEAWEALFAEAREDARRVGEALGLTPEEFARLEAKGALWWLEGALER